MLPIFIHYIHALNPHTPTSVWDSWR